MITHDPRKMISFIVKGGLAILLFGVVAGCQTRSPSGAEPSLADEEVAYVEPYPEEVRPFVRKAVASVQIDRVLHEMELGIQAMVHGHLDVAERSFDYTLDRIEVTHAGTEEAARARSLWYEEETKEFKGEPYERAMAYYYRGILFLKEGDYDNARAVFNGAILQDAFAEEHQHRCDFALMFLMAAYASHLMGDRQTRDEDFAEVKALRPDFKEPDWDNDFLVIVETGKSPRKLGDGVGHYQMRLFRGRDFDDTRANLVLDGNEHLLYPTEDIAFQAKTRGSRPIDAILEGQVNFKRRTESIATNLTETAQVAMVSAPLLEGASSNVGAVAGGLGIVGVTAAMIAQNAKPRADTRYWSNLPDTVHTLFLPKTFRGQTGSFQFLTEEGAIVSETEKQIPDDAVVVWAKNNYE